MWDLEDLDGIVRCIMWPDAFAEYGELVQPDAILAMRAAVDRRPGSEETNLIVSELIPLDDLPTRFTSGVMIRIDEARHGESGLSQLREIVRGYPGNKPLRLRLDLADGGAVNLDCPQTRLEISPDLRRRVDDLLGPGNFKLLGAGPPRPKAKPKNGKGRAFAAKGRG
jgi:DNA polymerase-3 subunit alpha